MLKSVISIELSFDSLDVRCETSWLVAWPLTTKRLGGKQIVAKAKLSYLRSYHHPEYWQKCRCPWAGCRQATHRSRKVCFVCKCPYCINVTPCWVLCHRSSVGTIAEEVMKSDWTSQAYGENVGQVARVSAKGSHEHHESHTAEVCENYSDQDVHGRPRIWLAWGKD